MQQIHKQIIILNHKIKLLIFKPKVHKKINYKIHYSNLVNN